jgi:hypothetical protein
VRSSPDHDSDRRFLPTLGQALVLWILFLVAKSLGGMFARGTFALRRAFPAAPRPSLTMGVG